MGISPRSQPPARVTNMGSRQTPIRCLLACFTVGSLEESDGDIVYVTNIMMAEEDENRRSADPVPICSLEAEFSVFKLS